MRRQCALLGLSRSRIYYTPVAQTEGDSLCMRRMDELYTESPFYGSRKLVACLRREGFDVNRKRIQRLMHLLGLQAIYQKPRTSISNKAHKKYPYLLSNLVITRPDHVWSADITYIRLRCGFVYLTAIIDWYSRYVLAAKISTTLDMDFCLEALDESLIYAKPEIFNTDQGCQFTSDEFTGRLMQSGIRISMDGKGRALDNIFVERLWRSVKYEEVYTKDYENVAEARSELGRYFLFYNNKRPHQSLNYKTPAEVYGRAQQGQSTILF